LLFFALAACVWLWKRFGDDLLDLSSPCVVAVDALVSDLDDKSLYGTIPPQLMLLSDTLTGTLNFYDNQLSGPIPSGIGSLSNLEDGLCVALANRIC